jgi:hypothetical protein
MLERLHAALEASELEMERHNRQLAESTRACAYTRVAIGYLQSGNHAGTEDRA